jgi:hypothetical protein
MEDQKPSRGRGRPRSAKLTDEERRQASLIYYYKYRDKVLLRQHERYIRRKETKDAQSVRKTNCGATLETRKFKPCASITKSVLAERLPPKVLKKMRAMSDKTGESVRACARASSQSNKSAQ